MLTIGQRKTGLGSELTLRRAALKTTTFELGGGQAEAVAPFRARHANTRHTPVPATHRRRASRAKPCPTPQPRPGGSTGGRRAARQRRDRLPGQRRPRRATAGHAGQPQGPSGRRQNPAAPGRGCGVGQGGVREARRPSWRLRGASPCVRVPRLERRHGRGLAAPTPRLQQSVALAQTDRPAAALESPLFEQSRKVAMSRNPPLQRRSPGANSHGAYPVPVQPSVTAP